MICICAVFFEGFLFNLIVTFPGIGRVALDTRLGCLEPNLDPKSEPQQIINAAKYALRNVATLELKFPFWRYFPTPLWSKYVNNMNYFVEICMKYIQAATVKMKSRTSVERAALGEPSLLEKVILSEKNEKIACIMALDLILVGIDTVSLLINQISRRFFDNKFSASFTFIPSHIKF